MSARAWPRGTVIAMCGLFGLLFSCMLYYGFALPLTPGMRKPSVDLISRVSLWHSTANVVGWMVPREPQWVVTALVSFAVVSFGAYAAAVVLCWKCRHRPSDPRWAIASTLALLLAAVGFLPNVNTDVYNYIMRGRVAAVYGENPYRTIAGAYPNDPFYKYAQRRYMSTTSTAKMPAWQVINAALARLAGDDPVTVLLVYRGALFAFNAVNVLLVWLILNRLRPDLATFGAIFYGWNPIVISFGQSKTDTVMVFYLLVGIYLLSRGRDRWAAVFLSLSAWVKLVTLPMLGAAWLGDLKLRNWSRLLWAAVIFCLVTLAVYVPYTHSPDLIVSHLLQMDKTNATTPGLLRSTCSAIFVLMTATVGFQQDGSPLRLIRGWAVLALYFALFLTKISLSWYLMVPIAIVAVAAEWRLATMTVVCSFCCYLINLRDGAFNHAFPAPELFSLPRQVAYLAMPAVTLLLIVVWELRGRRLVHSEHLT